MKEHAGALLVLMVCLSRARRRPVGASTGEARDSEREHLSSAPGRASVPEDTFLANFFETPRVREVF